MRELQEASLLHLRATLQFYPRTRKGTYKRHQVEEGEVVARVEEGVEGKIQVVGVTGYLGVIILLDL